MLKHQTFTRIYPVCGFERHFTVTPLRSIGNYIGYRTILWNYTNVRSFYRIYKEVVPRIILWSGAGAENLTVTFAGGLYSLTATS